MTMVDARLRRRAFHPPASTCWCLGLFLCGLAYFRAVPEPAFALRIDALLKDGGGFEHHDSAREDRHLLACLGVAPDRRPFLRAKNDPNEDNFTVSPRSRESVISLSTSSTSAADSLRDKRTF